MVAKLIVAPEAVICDECVEICVNLIDAPAAVDGGAGESPAPGGAPEAIVVCALCQVPSPADASVQIPDRGCLCAACTDAIRVALGDE
jgi:ATP-dependent protease Clp ATPase subunit